jgi:hypothetical protein
MPKPFSNANRGYKIRGQFGVTSVAMRSCVQQTLLS